MGPAIGRAPVCTKATERRAGRSRKRTHGRRRAKRAHATNCGQSSDRQGRLNWISTPRPTRRAACGLVERVVLTPLLPCPRQTCSRNGRSDHTRPTESYLWPPTLAVIVHRSASSLASPTARTEEFRPLISCSAITDHGAQREHDLAGRRNVGEAGTFSLRR